MCARETGARAVLRAKASGPKAGSHGRRLCVGEEGHQQEREGDEPEVLRRPLRERPVDASHTRVADANDRPAINRRSHGSRHLGQPTREVWAALEELFLESRSFPRW